MIGYIRGKVLKALPTGVILDVQGVGYELNLSLRHISRLPSVGEEQVCWVYTRVREDEISLYGFESEEERQTFSVLIQLNGVGPKVALAILSVLGIGGLRRSVEHDEPGELTIVPGIGKRTAEKIIVELKGRLDRLPSSAIARQGDSSSVVERSEGSARCRVDRRYWEEQLEPDLRSALENLGFREKDIAPVLRELRQEALPEEGFPGLIRRALKRMTQAGKGLASSSGSSPVHDAASLNRLF